MPKTPWVKGLAALICLGCVGSVTAAKEQALAPPTRSTAEGPVGTLNRDILVDNGLRALYNWDYDGARNKFELLKMRYPQDPLAYYAQATLLWWELTNEYDEKNPALEVEFLKAVDHTLRLTKKSSAQGQDVDGVAHLCLGGALGLRSRWDVIQGKWFRAYRDGKAAYAAQKKAIEINPDLNDAYLGVGIFNYYTATLPSVIKALAKLVFGGNKEQGLAYIHRAMTGGRYSRTAAQLFLIGIYNNTEKKPAEALALVHDLRREYPDSPFAHFLELLTLENNKKFDALRELADDYLVRIEKGQRFYSPRYKHRALFAKANSFLGEGRAPQALALYDDILAAPHPEDRWITWTHLNRGRALDLLNRRAEARAAYQTVLHRRDVWQMHDQAKDCLKTPHAAGSR